MDADNIEIGRMTMREAIQLARSMGMKLFVVRENVVRIYDHQKMREQLKERSRRTKEKHGVRDIVEIKLSLNVDEDAYQEALCKAQKVLSKGDIVKLMMSLRGSAMVYKESAFQTMKRFTSDLNHCANTLKFPKLENRCFIAILEPVRT